VLNLTTAPTVPGCPAPSPRGRAARGTSAPGSRRPVRDPADDLPLVEVLSRRLLSEPAVPDVRSSWLSGTRPEPAPRPLRHRRTSPELPPSPNRNSTASRSWS